MRSKHYLVTGGAGLIGISLVRTLIHEGHRVTVFDNFSTGRRKLLKGTTARIISGDVRDNQALSAAVRRSDCVVHLASIVGVTKTRHQPVNTLLVGLDGTQNVLQAATEYDREVFLASSSAVYGKIENSPVDETADCRFGSPDNPSWTYSSTKLACEHLAFGYRRTRGTNIKIGRFFNVIGPHQHPKTGMVVPTFVSRALAGRPLEVYGSGSQTRTFVDVQDAVRGTMLICRRGKPGTAYNIGGTREISIMSLAKKIRTLTGSESRIKLTPYREAHSNSFEETQQRKPDISRLRDLGFSPQFTLDQTLRRIIAHFRKKGDL